MPKQSKAVPFSRCPLAGTLGAVLRAVLSVIVLLCLLVAAVKAQDPVSDTLKHYLAAKVGDITGQVSLAALENFLPALEPQD